jgi:hypothetical protein
LGWKFFRLLDQPEETMKPAPSTLSLMAITVVAAMLVSFAAGMEFANSRHEAAAMDSLDAQGKFLAQADETDRAYRSRLRQIESACSGQTERKP